MLHGWLAYQPGDDLDDDGRVGIGPDRFTIIPVGPDIPRYVLLICGFLNARASRPTRRRLRAFCRHRTNRKDHPR
jgi:hypothetical protein